MLQGFRVLGFWRLDLSGLSIGGRALLKLSFGAVLLQKCPADDGIASTGCCQASDFRSSRDVLLELLPKP